FGIGGGGMDAGLGGQVGQQAVQPAGQRPGGRPEQVHQRGHQQAADDQCVDQDGEAEREAELGQDPVAAEQERPEDQDHDAGRARDDPAAAGQADGDGLVVAPGGAGAQGGQVMG